MSHPLDTISLSLATRKGMFFDFKGLFLDFQFLAKWIFGFLSLLVLASSISSPDYTSVYQSAPIGCPVSEAAPLEASVFSCWRKKTEKKLGLKGQKKPFSSSLFDHFGPFLAFFQNRWPKKSHFLSSVFAQNLPFHFFQSNTVESIESLVAAPPTPFASFFFIWDSHSTQQAAFIARQRVGPGPLQGLQNGVWKDFPP